MRCIALGSLLLCPQLSSFPSMLPDPRPVILGSTAAMCSVRHCTAARCVHCIASWRRYILRSQCAAGVVVRLRLSLLHLTGLLLRVGHALDAQRSVDLGLSRLHVIAGLGLSLSSWLRAWMSLLTRVGSMRPGLLSLTALSPLRLCVLHCTMARGA